MHFRPHPQLSPKNPVHCYAISIETGNPGIPHEVTKIPSNLQSPALKCQSRPNLIFP